MVDKIESRPQRQTILSIKLNFTPTSDKVTSVIHYISTIKMVLEIAYEKGWTIDRISTINGSPNERNPTNDIG